MVYHFVKDCLLLSLSGPIGRKESRQWRKKLEITSNVFSLNSEITEWNNGPRCLRTVPVRTVGCKLIASASGVRGKDFLTWETVVLLNCPRCFPFIFSKGQTGPTSTFHVPGRAAVSGVLQPAEAKPSMLVPCFCSVFSQTWNSVCPGIATFLAKNGLILNRSLLLLEWHGNIVQHLGFALVLLEEELQCFSLEMSSRCKLSATVVLWCSVFDYDSNLWKKKLSNGRFLKQMTIVVLYFETSKQAWIKTIRNMECKKCKLTFGPKLSESLVLDCMLIITPLPKLNLICKVSFSVPIYTNKITLLVSCLVFLIVPGVVITNQ